MLYGAISTWRQARGKAAMVSPGPGFAGSLGGGCKTAWENQ
jgi:hypothetical protein